jgi:hypothetical protein
MSWSPMSKEQRQSRFPAVVSRIVEVVKHSNLPEMKVPAGTIMFRKVRSARTSVSDQFRYPLGKWVGDEWRPAKEFPNNTIWHPDIPELMRISPRSTTADHRWSGMLPNGRAGIGGSYWASMHGVLAEDYFYNVHNSQGEPTDFQPPPSGFISPRFAPTVVDGRQRLEKYVADLPTQIPVNGGSISDLLIGRIKRETIVLAMHPANEWFREWNAGVSRELKKELAEIGYDRMDQGLLDVNDRILSRLVANVASDCDKDAVFSPSVRREELDWSVGYKKDLATNLALQGEPNESLNDRVELVGLLEIRPSMSGQGGLTATRYDVDHAFSPNPKGGIVDRYGQPYRKD